MILRKQIIKRQPNYIQISRRLEEIKRSKRRVPPIDFGLRLDTYHASDQSCLHCRKDVLSNHLYVDSSKPRNRSTANSEERVRYVDSYFRLL